MANDWASENFKGKISEGLLKLQQCRCGKNHLRRLRVNDSPALNGKGNAKKTVFSFGQVF
jgi:hypothetical protein